MRTIKVTKIKNDYVLIIPETYVKLYSIKKDQEFQLEIKESENDTGHLFLTYATMMK